MEKKKVSTILDPTLYRRAKLEAARRDRPVSDLIAEALTQYLAGDGSTPSGAAGVAARSFGALALPRERVRAILEEEDGLLDP